MQFTVSELHHFKDSFMFASGDYKGHVRLWDMRAGVTSVLHITPVVSQHNECVMSICGGQNSQMLSVR